jgi:hypothetical protein
VRDIVTILKTGHYDEVGIQPELGKNHLILLQYSKQEVMLGWEYSWNWGEEKTYDFCVKIS